MKKKVVAMLLLAVLATGCGANGNVDVSNEQASEEASVAASVDESVEEAIEAASESSSEEASDAASSASSDEAALETSADNNLTEGTEAGAQSSTSLKDGSYTTDLRTSPQYSPGYIKSVEFTGDTIVLEAVIYQYDENWNEIVYDMAKYTLKTNDSTEYVSGGGEEDPIQMSRDEFAVYLTDTNMMDSGLGLSFSIKNGVVKQIGIWS